MISLNDWMPYIRAAGIPFIDAMPIVDIPMVLIQRFEDEWHHLQSYIHQVDLMVGDGQMVRWDCCATYPIKQNLGAGRWQWREEFRRLDFDDPRLHAILYRDWDRPMVPVWAREWMQARIVDDYPEEYRVFVEDGQVQGVSSYYPQRPLPSSAKYIAKEAVRLTEQILEHTDGLDAFTADFMLSEQYDDLFWIEGGPPHRSGRGAHPCCFKPGEIDGIALEDRNE